MNRARTIIAACLLALAAGGALAQQGKVALQTAVQKEQRSVDEAGEVSMELVEADKVVPGDVVIYTVTYTNVSDESVENIVITNPIPAQLTFVPDSSFSPGAEVSFSADGGATWGELDALVVRDGDAERIATAEDLTHIRWRLTGELESGEQGFTRFRAQLN